MLTFKPATNIRTSSTNLPRTDWIVGLVDVCSLSWILKKRFLLKIGTCGNTPATNRLARCFWQALFDE